VVSAPSVIASFASPTVLEHPDPGDPRGQELLRRVREDIAPAPLRYTRDEAGMLQTRKEIGEVLADLATQTLR
jgi:hypothetical protein